MERSIKRLVITLIASIVIIMIAKALLVKAATNAGYAATERRKQLATRQIMSRPASSPSSAVVPLD